jgi:hypothetical protein
MMKGIERNLIKDVIDHLEKMTGYFFGNPEKQHEKQ